MASTTETPKRRRRFAISLRVSMLLVVLAALPMGWRSTALTRSAGPSRRSGCQARTSDTTSKNRGRPSRRVRRGFGGSSETSISRRSCTYASKRANPRRWPPWASSTGSKICTSATLERTLATPWRKSENWKRLRELGLWGESGLRDDMLASLDGLPELLWLYIFDADLGDAGLARLGHLRKLESLEISSRSLVPKKLVTDLGSRPSPGRCLSFASCL